jgi:hypothetical protein
MKLKTLFIIAAVAIATAVYLRLGAGSPLRDAITYLIGYDWRACLEHMLAGIGVPLIVPAGIVLGSYHGDRWLHRVSGGRFANPAGSLEEYLDFRVLTAFVATVAVAFLIAEYQFESLQATVSVYGNAPRGYFQYDQYCADVIGAAIAVRLAIHFWQSNRSDIPQPSLIRRARQPK